MVLNGEIDGKTKASVKFLKEQTHLTVKEITKRCGVSRGTVYRCLKSVEKKAKNKSSISSMNRRLELIIKGKGKRTKY